MLRHLPKVPASPPGSHLQEPGRTIHPAQYPVCTLNTSAQSCRACRKRYPASTSGRAAYTLILAPAHLLLVLPAALRRALGRRRGLGRRVVLGRRRRARRGGRRGGGPGRQQRGSLGCHVVLGLAPARREQRQRLGIAVELGRGRRAAAGALAGARLARLRTGSPLPSAQGMFGAFPIWVLLRAALVPLAPLVPLPARSLCQSVAGVSMQ